MSLENLTPEIENLYRANLQRVCNCGFCHLHGHTDYSALDGYGKPTDIITRIKELGFGATAITDHGNVNAYVPFANALQTLGSDVKPIYGCEFYIVEDASVRTREQKNLGVNATPHITIIALNQKGFENILKLTKISYDNFYYKPRIDFDTLFKYQEGLAVFSGCAAGWPTRFLLNDDVFSCRQWLRNMKRHIENFYVELIPQFDFHMSQFVTPTLIQLAHEENIPLITTADAHFPSKEDWSYQDTMLCIGMGKRVGEHKQVELPYYQYYCSVEELLLRGIVLGSNSKQVYPELHKSLDLAQYTEGIVQGIENAGKIATLAYAEQPICKPVVWKHEGFCERVKKSEVQVATDDRFQKYIQKLEAKYNGPNTETILVERVYTGLAKRMHEGYIPQNKLTEYLDRAERELVVICDKKFADYIHIVGDLFDEENSSGGFTVCRGSAGGCILLWALYGSEVDPILYDLSFERFYDTTRNDAPDVDIDFCPKNRTEAIRRLEEKYGENCVAKLLNTITLKGKVALIDAARTLGIDRKTITPIIQKISVTSDNTDEVFEDAEVMQILDEHPGLGVVKKLLGHVRNFGINAAGVVLASDDLEKSVAIMTKNGETFLSVDKKLAPTVGLLKLDLLSVKAYQVLLSCIHKIGKTPREFFLEVHKTGFQPEVFKYAERGKVVGIFQLDGTALSSAKAIGLSSIHDLIAVNALCRPGAGVFVPDYVRHKADSQAFTNYKATKDERWNNIVESTFGVLLYQEQIMRVCRELAGMEWKDVHAMRKNIAKNIEHGGKIDADLMEKFVTGLRANGFGDEFINYVWKRIETHAKYSFNKSHCVAYAYIMYCMLYFKYYHRDIYYSSYLEIEDDDFLIKRLIVQYEDEGGRVTQFSPEASKKRFSYDEKSKTIVGGWSNIKGIGDKIAEKIESTDIPIEKIRFLGGSMFGKIMQAIDSDNPQDTIKLWPWAKVQSIAPQHQIVYTRYNLKPIAKTLETKLNSNNSGWEEMTCAGYVTARKIKPMIGNSKSEKIILIVEDTSGVVEVQVPSSDPELALKFREQLAIGDFVFILGSVPPNSQTLFVKKFVKV